MLYEVYIATIKNKIVYIGSGQSGKRHKHITSGTSHVYLLNQIHFSNPKSITVLVLHSNLTKERSLELEMSLIHEYQPAFNNIGTKTLNNKYEQQHYYNDLVENKK